jgi:predicted deacylase
LAFFKQQGLIDQEAIKLPEVETTTVGVEQVKLVAATVAGVVVYHCELNDFVEKGALLAEIVLLDEPSPTRVPISAPCPGLVFSQTNEFYVSPGQTVAMLATREKQNEVGSQLAF